MFKFAVFSALLAVSCAVVIPFEECPGLPSPSAVTISECTQLPCDMHIGDRFTLNFIIEATGVINALPVTVTIEQDGQTMTFPLPTGDACSAIATGCPLQAGPHIVSFPVTLVGVPTGVSTITVDITDETGSAVACGTVTTDIGA